MNIAQKVLQPTTAGIFRTAFLYTGQGEVTLMIIPTGPQVSDYIYVLIDCDEDKGKDEIEVVKMLQDLFKDKGRLSVYINTHPHKDHLAGVQSIYDSIGIDEVWHSNHKPSGSDDSSYQELKYVLKKIGKQNEYHLKGTRSLNTIQTSRENIDEKVTKKLGNINFQVLSPAKFVCEDIESEESDETRRKRIHEQCGVIKFTYNGISILITGDSDKTAWQDNSITDYYYESLPSTFLSASHHGSYTFFKDKKDDEDVFLKHIQKISPEYTIISAPKQSESKHDHPHDEALKIYKEYSSQDVLHLGNEDGNPYSVIVDIDNYGRYSVNFDEELIKAYGYKDEEVEESSKSNSVRVLSSGFGIGTKLDNKPMG
jgi:competence protein ComEC